MIANDVSVDFIATDLVSEQWCFIEFASHQTRIETQWSLTLPRGRFLKAIKWRNLMMNFRRLTLQSSLRCDGAASRWLCFDRCRWNRCFWLEGWENHEIRKISSKKIPWIFVDIIDLLKELNSYSSLTKKIAEKVTYSHSHSKNDVLIVLNVQGYLYEFLLSVYQQTTE